MLLTLITVTAFLLAYLTSSAIVPPITRMAVSKRLLDYPDGDRHTHSHAVPRLGGVAVFAALFVVAIACVVLSGFLPSAPTLSRLAGPLLLASTGLFAIGLTDDLKGVRPALKIIAQTAAALLVYHAGFKIDVLSFPPNYEMALGSLSLPVTVLWLVGVSNAFNLIDGLDGLAGGVAVIALLAIAATSLILGNTGVLICTIALLGALLGFLRFNFPPARIFLGDSGSLVVGFLLAVLTVKGATRHTGVLYALMPIFALSYLLLDTGIAIMRRWLRGDPLSRADGRHIHHQLRAIGLSPRRAVLTIYAQAATAAALGLCVTFTPPAVTVAVAAAGAVMLMFLLVYGIRRLDYHEFVAAQASVASVARNARAVIQDKINARDVARAIAAAKTFGEIQTIVAGCATTFRFAHMELGDAGSVTAALPIHIALELRLARLWRLQYPIAQHKPQSEPLFLSVCCPTITARHRPVGAERVIQILAPAIVSWMAIGQEDVIATRASETEIAIPVARGADSATAGVLSGIRPSRAAALRQLRAGMVPRAEDKLLGDAMEGVA